MTQGTRKIELLTAVMNDVIVPEKIYFMTPAVHPITLEIDDKECNNVGKNGSLNMKDRNFIYEPGISDDRNTNTQHIFYNIGITHN